MSIAAVPSAAAAFVPLRLRGHSLAVKSMAVLLATLFLTACSWISVPMVPVPITMQTFAITIVGATFGWRLGTAAVLAWLLEGALGLPVFAGGPAGVAHFMGPTGGYLVSFPIAAAVVGWCSERGLMTRNWPVSLGIMLGANAAMLLFGATWLAHFIGVDQAIAHGVVPFLLGGALKAALATASLEAARRQFAR